MRVLHLYSAQYIGGIETFLITLARFHSICPEMESEFALCFDGYLSEQLETENATIHRMGDVRIRYPWTVFRARRVLRNLLKEKEYDVVVCHSIWNYGIFGAVVRDTGLPLVFYQHNIFNGKDWFEHWARRVIPDYVICNSRYTQSTLSSIFPEAKSQVVYFPVAPPKRFTLVDRTAIRAELQTSADAVVIIQASQMASWKGHIVHLNALAKLADLSNWTLWVAGGPQVPSEQKYFSDLHQEAKRLGISNRVRFLGKRTDVPRLLVAANILCQPNINPEPFGIVFVEALGYGLPVVSSAIGGALEVVDESCGVLVPRGDTVSLANALRDLIVNSKMRQRLATAGPSRAKLLCSPEKQIRLLEQVLRSVTASATVPPSLRLARADSKG